MPAAAVLALQAQLDELAGDDTLDAGDRIRDLRALRSDLESLIGIADRLIGDEQLREESVALEREHQRMYVRENADIREELLRRNMATEEELDAAGLWSHAELDRRAAEGLPLEEAFMGKVDPAKLAAIAKKRRRDHGKFADEFGSPAKPKGRGGAALPMGKALPGGGTPNAPGGTSAEATARAKAAARRPDYDDDAAQITSRKKRMRDAELDDPGMGRGAAVKLDIHPDKDGWIDVGGDVNKAADLLAQGKMVRLAEKHEASMLLDELAKRVQAAKAAGDSAPNFNLCKITVQNTNLFCAESKGVPRIKMPQLGGVPIPGSPADSMEKDESGSVNLTGHFREMLEANGAKVTDDEAPAANLKASQNELNGGKVASMAQVLASGKQLGGDPRIFVSHDDYIVDGHHRWAANVGHDLADGQEGDVMMPVARVDMDIIELLAAANQYAKEMGLPQAAMGDDQTKPPEGAVMPEPPASPGTEKPKKVDPGHKAHVDQQVKAMYREEDAAPAEQNFESLDALYEAAERAQPEFTELLTQGLPDMLGATVPGFEEALASARDTPEQPQVLMGPMKKKERSLEKVAANYDGDHNQLKDVVRATVLVGKAEELPTALEAVRRRAEEKGWTIRGAEDKFSDGPPPPWVKGPTSAGYSDTKVYLVSPDGIAAELQFNTNVMFIAKEGEGHKLYEEQRSIEASIKARAKEAASAPDAPPAPPASPGTTPAPHHGPTAAEIARLRELKKRQSELYGAAREASYG
jgi:hypothetical protein